MIRQIRGAVERGYGKCAMGPQQRTIPAGSGVLPMSEPG